MHRYWPVSPSNGKGPTMTDAFRVQLVDFDDKDTINQIGLAMKEALAEQGKGSWVGTSASWLGAKAVEAIN